MYFIFCQSSHLLFSQHCSRFWLFKIMLLLDIADVSLQLVFSSSRRLLSNICDFILIFYELTPLLLCSGSLPFTFPPRLSFYIHNICRSSRLEHFWRFWGGVCHCSFILFLMINEIFRASFPALLDHFNVFFGKYSHLLPFLIGLVFLFRVSGSLYHFDILALSVI